MSNDYFAFSDPVARNTLVRAEVYNALGQALEDAFDLLPEEDRLNQDRVTYATRSGTANAIVLTIPATLTAYVEGMSITWKVAAANTSTVTVNVNTLGARSLLRSDGDPLAANDLRAGAMVTARFDGLSFRLIGTAPGEVEAIVNETAWTYNAGNLPGLSGAEGKALTVQGGTPLWDFVIMAKESALRGDEGQSWQVDTEDGAGRVLTASDTFNGIPRTFTYTYDSAGRAETIAIGWVTFTRTYTFTYNGTTGRLATRSYVDA